MCSRRLDKLSPLYKFVVNSYYVYKLAIIFYLSTIVYMTLVYMVLCF
jgi:hypothetical protein